MDRLRIVDTFIWPLAACCLLGIPMRGADVTRFFISQAQTQTRVSPPRVTAYLDALDAEGRPAGGFTVSGSVDTHPLTLVSILPFGQSKEGVAYVFLIDVSGSIGPSQFSQMRAAIAAWIDDLEPADRVALFAFGNESRQVADFTTSRSDLKSALDALAPRDRKTQFHTALAQAMELAKRNDAGLPSRRVIVVLTDGKDEGSGRTAEDVLPAIKTVHMPIYAIGFSRLPLKERQRYLDLLKRFADNSGGMYREAGAEPLQSIYEEMRQAIRGVWTATFDCAQCQADGQFHKLQINLTTTGNRSFSDNLDIPIPTPPPRPLPPRPLWWKTWWVLTIGGVLVMSGIALIIVFAVRGGKQEEFPPHSLPPPLDEYVPAEQPEPRGLRVRLAVVKGTHPGSTHEVRLVKRAVIGRREGCDVVLPDDDEISGRHCELALIDGKVVVYDLKSRNGTSVNGVPIMSRCRLESGDAILVGRTELRVTFQEGL